MENQVESEETVITGNQEEGSSSLGKLRQKFSDESKINSIPEKEITLLALSLPF